MLLDFGLVLPLETGAAGAALHVAGTPAYMPPEQARGGRISEASDWYAVGVMLFQALTGRTPFRRLERAALLHAKTSFDAPRVSRIAPGVPRDLDELCAALLSRDPAQRPGGDEILSRLGQPAGMALRSRSIIPDEAPPFVGRPAELARIEAAHAETREGRAAVVWVHGPSGIGKSRLCQTFLDALVARDPHAVVLNHRA